MFEQQVFSQYASRYYRLRVFASRFDRPRVPAACFLILSGKKRRRHWDRPLLKSRDRYSLTQLLTDLRQDDTDPVTGDITEAGQFKNFTRISWDDFTLL